MEFHSKQVGETIRRIRKEKGLTQEVLSGLAGIARTHLAMIESGQKSANLETVWKVARALEMKPSELIEQIENQSKT